MATNIPMFLFFIHIWMISAQETSSDQAVPQKRPHLTGCVSANMETFRCRWNVGTFQNLSEPGNLRLFYINKKITDNEWSECPHYTADRPHECFFNENHTTVWTKYSVRLLSQDETVLYDEDYFLIQDIVRPDPPSGLNWTLLNVGLTGSHFDILVNWKPPESADVQMGWMTLQYEVQYRGVNATLWTVADLEKTTQRSIYGLETNISHEVRVRCKMLGYRYFGNFSESIFISVPSTVSRFPVAILLVFAGLCLVGILMLIVVSQQQKLMIIFLPPIPGPKIRGIDPELLKKGKLLELTSILGDHPDLRPELYNDHWVEFIELDIEEPNDHLTSDADTDCLVDCSPSSSDGTPLSIGFRDDDSGHASCCDPDMPCCDAETLPFHSLLSRRRSSLETSALAADPSSPSLAQNPASAWEWPLVAFPGGREEVYTQVSEVRASGELLLAREEESTADAAAADRGKIKMETEKERIKKGFVQRVNSMNASGYTSELDVGKMNARLSASVDTAGEPFQRGEDASFVAAASQAFGDYQPPYLESSQASARPPLPPPAPVYTVVEGVNTHNSLLLTPNLTPGPPQREVVPKAMPTPEGYLTPDLLGNVTP